MMGFHLAEWASIAIASRRNGVWLGGLPTYLLDDDCEVHVTTKTRPLSIDARNVLQSLAYAKKPLLRKQFNPGIVKRLLRDGLVTSDVIPSPYPGHNKGRDVMVILLTELGRAFLAR